MKIANRYRPFSHKPGISCIIPQSSFIVKAYPVCLIVQDSSGKQSQIEWNLTGPIKNFTLMQDLERFQVIVSGIANEGFFSYLLFSKDKALVLKVDRAPEGTLKGLLKEEGISSEISLKSKDLFYLSSSDSIEPRVVLEKLSFGNHKAQDWDLIQRRKNPIEYLPFWFALGQSVTHLKKEKASFDDGSSTTVCHLEDCEAILDTGDKEVFMEKLEEIFHSGFDDLMVPRLYDHQFLGLTISSQKMNSSSKVPIELLYEGYRLIRKMVFYEADEKIHILKNLSSKFHSGRCLNLTASGSLFDLEWSKKLIKKIGITVFETQTLLFSFQKSLKTFRLTSSTDKKGVERSCGDSLVLKPGFYTLDQFKK